MRHDHFMSPNYSALDLGVGGENINVGNASS
jgi:hypothetical protein